MRLWLPVVWLAASGLGGMWEVIAQEIKYDFSALLVEAIL